MSYIIEELLIGGYPHKKKKKQDGSLPGLRRGANIPKFGETQGVSVGLGCRGGLVGASGDLGEERVDSSMMGSGMTRGGGRYGMIAVE